MSDEQIIQHKTRAISAKNGQWVALAATRVWLKVKDIMNDQVVTIGPMAPLAEAAMAMACRRVSCLVVTEAGAVKGILTDKDIVRQIHNAQGTLYQRMVFEAMTSPVGCIDPDQTIVEASRIMEARGFRRLPVVDQGQLKGIITQTDLTRALISSHALTDVGEIMSKDVATVPKGATVAEAAAVMAARRISSVVVVDTDGPLGVLTEKDLVRKVTALERDPLAVQVTEVMSSPLISVVPVYSVFCAGRMMDQMHLHRLVVIEDQRLVGILTQTDIFRAVQRRLQAEEEKALQLFDSSKAGVYILDMESRSVYLNSALLALLELDDPGEFIDRPFLPGRFWVDPEDRNAFIDKLHQGDVQIEELRLKTAKGNPLYVSVVSTFLRDIHGRVSGINGTFHDVTAKKLAEEASALAYERLEKMNRELKQVQSQIVQSKKLATIGQLAANTPVGFLAANFEALQKYMHCMRRFVVQYDELAALIEPMEQGDLKTKLAQIQGTRQAMKIDFILEDIQSLFDESREGIERVTAIVRNLQDFSRGDAGDKLDDTHLKPASSPR
jgi:PAS domain S-box-containing protein